MDIDLDTPAVVAPGDRASLRAPAAPGDHPSDPLELVVADRPTGHMRPRSGDDQLYAAAELIRLGLATRVVLVNAPVDPALPTDWEIRGTPVHLERLGDGRTLLALGPSPTR